MPTLRGIGRCCPRCSTPQINCCVIIQTALHHWSPVGCGRAWRSPMPEKLKLYWRLARLDKPVGRLLLLWPTLWAVWIAGEGKPQPGIVVIFILGVIIMRAAGCVINDYLDRDFDPQVASYARPPARKRCQFSPRSALGVCGADGRGVFAGADAQPPDDSAGRLPVRLSRDLPARQTVHEPAAGVSRGGVFLGHPQWPSARRMRR